MSPCMLRTNVPQHLWMLNCPHAFQKSCFSFFWHIAYVHPNDVDEANMLLMQFIGRDALHLYYIYVHACAQISKLRSTFTMLHADG